MPGLEMPRPTDSPARTCRPAVIVSAVIAVAVMALYGRTVGFDYVFDDEYFILRNPGLALGLSWDGLRWAFTSTYHANWHPLAWLAHFADRAVFGPTPGPAHLVNAVAHAGCCSLLFLVLRRLTGAFGPSAFAAAAFAVHPLRVESVAWVTERKDPLSAVFSLFAIGAYLRYVRRPNAARYALVVLFFVFGLMTKPSVVTFPIVLLLLDWWPLGRLRLGRGNLHAGPAPARLFLEKVPLLALSIALGLVTFAAQSEIGAVMRLASSSIPVRIANAVITAATYLGKTVWPSGLAIYYPSPDHPSPRQVIVACLGLTAAAIGAIRNARRRPFLAVGLGWYLVTLLPVSGLVQVGAQAMADRFTYLPSLGVLVAISWGIAGWVAVHPRLAPLVAGSAVVALLVHGSASWGQIGYWRDNASLYRRALAVTKDNWMAMNNYGALIEQDGDLAGAIRYYRRAAELRPGFFEAHLNLASGLERAAAGRVTFPDAPQPQAEAESHYRKALALNPESPEAALGLSALLARRGRNPEAVELLTGVLDRHPEIAVAQMNLANLLATEGRFGEAFLHYRQALKLAPNFVEAHYNHGVALEQSGRWSDARAEYEVALRLDPRHPGAAAGLERHRSAYTPSRAPTGARSGRAP